MGEQNKQRYVWGHRNLDMLLEKANLSRRRLADVCGLKEGSVKQYFTYGIFPSMQVMLKLADYFGVPLDFLADRCDEELTNDILKDYSKHFMEMRRGPYEAYLIGRDKSKIHDTPNAPKWEAPWPYNFAEAVYQSPITWLLTSDHEEGIEIAMGTLSPRERTATLLYFKDGKTLEEIGKLECVTRERVRQIIAKALRKLRHPAKAPYILYGKSYCEERDICKRKIMEAKLKKVALDIEAAQLEELERALAMKHDAYRMVDIATVEHEDTLNTPLEELDLSVRSFNCLRRANVQTLRDILPLLESGNILRVRNLGRKSVEEILGKVRAYTGKDYSDMCFSKEASA